jgi:hypothetical protein
VTTLSGTVTLPGGEPATDAVVELHNSANDIVDQVQVDDAGAYTYHLAPGRWSLRVWDPHGHRASADVMLKRGEQVTLDLQLDQPASEV